LDQSLVKVVIIVVFGESFALFAQEYCIVALALF